MLRISVGFRFHTLSRSSKGDVISVPLEGLDFDFVGYIAN